MKISGAKSLCGTVHLPGDKSISHRAALIASIATGPSVITNFALNDDCRSTIECLTGLGVAIDIDGSTVTIHGKGKTGMRAPLGPLNCGNSGTTMRLLAGILAGQSFPAELTGDASLNSRPMGRIIDPLAQFGVSVASAEGKAPLRFPGTTGTLTAITYRPPISSAQIKSCVLLAGLYAEGTTAVIEPVSTRDHTERMLRVFGADIAATEAKLGREIRVRGGSELSAADIDIPCDPSAAAFFAVAAAVLKGSHVTMPNVGINPSRTGFLDLLRDIGCDIELRSQGESNGEPSALIDIKDGPELRSPAVIDGELTAQVIDEVPILAVLGTQLPDGIEIRGAEELRVKESDRIAAVAENLKRMGADVTEFPDGLQVRRSDLQGARIDSFGDHRIAMAFGIAALFAEGETSIMGAEAAAVSFPDFFEVLETIAVH